MSTPPIFLPSWVVPVSVSSTPWIPLSVAALFRVSLSTASLAKSTKTLPAIDEDPTVKSAVAVSFLLFRSVDPLAATLAVFSTFPCAGYLVYSTGTVIMTLAPLLIDVRSHVRFLPLLTQV